MRKLVLLSGGLDSVVAAREGGATDALFVAYGQAAYANELRAAMDLAVELGLEWHSIYVERCFSTPDSLGVIAARNALLVALGVNTAKRIGADALIIGCTMSDHEVFVDCRPDAIGTFRSIAEQFGVALEAPLLDRSRTWVKEHGRQFRGMTWSCYKNGVSPCGECLSCKQ